MRNNLRDIKVFDLIFDLVEIWGQLIDLVLFWTKIFDSKFGLFQKYTYDFGERWFQFLYRIISVGRMARPSVSNKLQICICHLKKNIYMRLLIVYSIIIVLISVGQFDCPSVGWFHILIYKDMYLRYFITALKHLKNCLNFGPSQWLGNFIIPLTMSLKHLRVNYLKTLYR